LSPSWSTPLIGDSKAVRDIIVKLGSLTKTRHFELAEMAAKRFYQMLVVVPYLVGTKDMAADSCRYLFKSSRLDAVLPPAGLHTEP